MWFAVITLAFSQSRSRCSLIETLYNEETRELLRTIVELLEVFFSGAISWWLRNCWTLLLPNFSLKVAKIFARASIEASHFLLSLPLLLSPLSSSISLPLLPIIFLLPSASLYSLSLNIRMLKSKFSLDEHLIEWCPNQFARCRAPSAYFIISLLHFQSVELINWLAASNLNDNCKNETKFFSSLNFGGV